MRSCPPQPRKRGLLAVALAVAFAVFACCAFVVPCRAVADDAAVIAHSGEGSQRVNYTSVEDAKNAAYAGAVIVMDADWDFGENRLELSGKKSVSIDMNGHTISSSHWDSSINLSDGVSLRLFSSAQAKQFAYQGYGPSGSSWNWCDLTVTAAGLVTNTVRSSDGAKGINLRSGASLTTENIAVAGCSAAGIALGEGTTVTLNSTTVCHNWRKSTDGDGGAGIYVGPTSKVTLNASHVDENYSAGKGGGIFADSGANIFMENGSTVSGNLAQAGGGFYFNQSFFTLKSNDGTGVISNNKATRCDTIAANKDHSGGGIHVDASSGKNESVIEGLAIKGNYSAYDGGGIELDQRWTTVRNCTITGNCSKYDGGGIFVFGGNNTLENCTVTGNACNVDSGGNYEGGGVFVSYHYDVNLSGVCVINGNTRGKDSGNADDVFLGTVSGGAGKAYITGNLAKGSTVGVRTGIDGDRRIAKNFKPETKDCLFYDLDGYYVSYGNDEGGDAWQRHTAIEFTVKLDGQVYGKYRNRTAVSVVAPATKGGKVFWRWDAKYTTGLYPVSDYLTEKTAFKNALSFSMPQNDVSLTPVYVDTVKSAMFAVVAPEAGKALSTSGQLVRTDGGVSGSATVPCAVYWYEVDEGGNVSDTSATGLAKAGTTYEAYVSAPAADDYGLYYDDAIKAENVTVRLVSESGETKAEEKATKAYVTLSNGLAAFTPTYTTDADAGKETKAGTVEVQLKNRGLLGEGEAAVAALALDADAEGQADVIDTVKVSFAYDDESDTVSIAAPAREGYNFCNWEVEGDGLVSDESVVNLSVSELLGVKSLTAVYTPVATALEVKLDAPEAEGELAATCADVMATCTDGEIVSFAKGLGVDSFDVTWSPETEDGKAGFSTAYTALIKLSDEEGFEDVEKALASGATVTCNGKEPVAAGFTLDADGRLCLALSFGETRAVRATNVSQPEAVEVSFEDAAAGEWGLPSTVLVTLESGEAVDAVVTWDAVEGFDANATAAQVLTAKGAVSYVVYDGELNTDGLDKAVTITVKVAAPAKQASDDTTTDDATKTETTAVAETKTTSKKGTPSTGDATWGGFAGLLAISAVCLAAARVSRREH